MVIPRIIHRIWFGPRAMPRAYVEYGNKWSELNPDWKLIDWDYWMLPPLQNKWHFDNVGTGWNPNPGAAKHNSIIQVAQADIAAYEILHLIGGLYVNCDMEPLRPIPEELTDHPVTLANEIDNWLISNAWMMSAPRQPLFSTVIDAIPENIKNEHRTIDWKTGPKLLTRIVKDNYPDTHILPAKYCNPWTPQVPTGPVPESLCQHHWGHRIPDSELWDHETADGP